MGVDRMGKPSERKKTTEYARKKALRLYTDATYLYTSTNLSGGDNLYTLRPKRSFQYAFFFQKILAQTR